MKRIIAHLKENGLKYGFETLVVTVGILAAFSLNNWNENRKERILEKGFLRNINIEFRMNKSQFEIRHRNHLTIWGMSQEMRSKFPITISNWDTIRSIFTPWFGVPVTFDPTQSSIESLQNSGSFDLIKDENLKKLLISWNDEVADYKEEEDQAVKFIIDHWWSFLMKDSNTQLIYDSSYMIPKSSWAEFENIVNMRMSTVAFMADSTSDRFYETEKLLSTMDSIILLTEPNAE
jgi:hypothetical protein